jgi:hypothetical protein
MLLIFLYPVIQLSDDPQADRSIVTEGGRVRHR